MGYAGSLGLRVRAVRGCCGACGPRKISGELTSGKFWRSSSSTDQDSSDERQDCTVANATRVEPSQCQPLLYEGPGVAESDWTRL